VGKCFFVLIDYDEFFMIEVEKKCSPGALFKNEREVRYTWNPSGPFECINLFASDLVQWPKEPAKFRRIFRLLFHFFTRYYFVRTKNFRLLSTTVNKKIKPKAHQFQKLFYNK
jgi:hypothetical protein